MIKFNEKGEFISNLKNNAGKVLLCLPEHLLTSAFHIDLDVVRRLKLHNNFQVFEKLLLDDMETTIKAIKEKKPSKKEKKGCSELLSPVVMANGDVTICCMDFRGEYIVGNVAEKTFKELWRSPPYKFMREKANSFRLPLCKKCPTRYR